MGVKNIIRKVFINSRNKQLTITLSKKEIRKVFPTIKFSDELFAKLKILKGKKNG